MNIKLPIVLVALIIALFLTVFYLAFFQKKAVAPIGTTFQTSPETSASAEVEDEILKNALNLYVEKSQQGVNFSLGPCLGLVGEDWVLDIAHNPRTIVDDDPQNQCPDFREGRAKHFIELDPDGKLIRMQ